MNLEKSNRRRMTNLHAKKIKVSQPPTGFLRENLSFDPTKKPKT